MVGLIALGVLVVALVGSGVATARPPAGEVPDTDGYLRRWRGLHGDVDPTANVWLHGWLRMSYAVARPLARRGVHPHVLTASTTWLALAAVVAAHADGRWRLVAGLLIVVSGLGDTLDGAVAVATDRTSRWGYVLDSTVDRVNDVLYLIAAWVVGAPAWLVVTAGVAVFLLEYVRARGRNAGASEVGTITVGERAMRVICAAIAVSGGVADGLEFRIATAAITILAVVSVIGLVQVLWAVRRDLERLEQSSAGS